MLFEQKSTVLNRFKQLVRSLGICLFLLSCTSLAKADETWTLAPGRTSIGFSVKHFVLMSVTGRFKDYQGNISIPSSGDFSRASVDVHIPVSSVFTGNSDRDEHLKTSDFFNAQAFPEIHFKSTAIKPKDATHFELIGQLTIRGISKSVHLDVEQLAIKALPNGSQRADYVATGAVNRYDFGLRWNELTEAGAMVVGDTVQIRLEASLLKAAQTNQANATSDASLTYSQPARDESKS